MIYTITPIKAKINDTTLSDTLNILINQDSGSACVFWYNIGFTPTATSSNPSPLFQQMAFGTYKIAGTDYENYMAVTNAGRMLFAAQYIATKLSLTLSTTSTSTS